MKKLKLIFATFALLLGVSNAWATDWTGNSVAAGTYYLYNVGADKFLNNGDPAQSWGTNAYLQAGFGMDIKLESGTGGAYKFDTNIYNGSDHYLNSSTWCDGAATEWTFTAVEGLSNTYTIKNGTSYLVANDALNDVEYKAITGDSKSYWKLISLDDFKTAMNAMTYSTTPMDVSVFIKGRSFARNDKDNDTWTTAHDGGNWTWVGASDNKYYGNESWNNTFSVKQEITGLPEGVYEVQCSGFGTNGTTYIYGNNTSKAIQTDNTTDRGTNAAAKWIAIHEDNAFAGQSSGTFYVSDGKITLGLKRETNIGGDWAIWDEFRLYYYGKTITNAGFSSNNNTGWSEDVAGAVSNSEIEYYNKPSFNLYQNLENLPAGIYALEAQGFYRNGVSIDVKRAKAQENLCAYLYAKGEDDIERTVALTSIYDEAGNASGISSLFGTIPNSMAQAQTFISTNLYNDNKLFVEVGEAGTVTIGAKKAETMTADWAILDNFSFIKQDYASLEAAYAAEWATKLAEANTLYDSGDYTNIISGASVRTALNTAKSATPSSLDEYISALADLRTAVNNFKAAKYAYNLYKTNYDKIVAVKAAENTTYKNITGEEKTTFDTAYPTATAAPENTPAAYYEKALTISETIVAFTGAKNNYDEYAAENATATLLGTDVTSVSVPTTSATALSAAHEINVLNYNKVVAEEYEDVSASALGDWTDNNVGVRTGQHWDGTDSSTYFEMNQGWGNPSWTMSRQQTVKLAAGKYILKVASRVSSNADATLSVTVGETTISTISGHQGDTGLGITTSGEASYISHDSDDSKLYAYDNKGRGFEWKYIPFEMAETGNATLKFEAEGHAIYNFVSFTSLALLTDPKVAARTTLLNKINEATAARMSSNEGTGVFQIPTSAGTTLADAISTAQGVYDNSEAELSDITTATTTLNTAITTYSNTALNAPDAAKRYNVTIVRDGKDWNSNAITFIAGGRDDQGLYAIKYLATANANLNQALKFTAVDDEVNTYKVSAINASTGAEQYITTGTTYGGNDYQIRTTDDASKASWVKIAATSTDGQFQLLNVSASNAAIADNDNNDMYTANTANFTIAEASQATVNVAISSDVKYGTRIFPFAPTLPEGVVAYSCEAEEDGVLKLVEVASPAANVPYILYAENGCASTDLTDWGVAGSTTATAGWLTGVYASTTATAGTYVLQNGDEGVGFYKVAEGDGKQPTVGANRCYMTQVISNPARVLKFNFGDVTDVKSVEAASEATLKDGKYFENGQIVIVKNGKKYNAAGAQVK